MSKKCKYEVGESILCNQGLLIYEAKILDIKQEDSVYYYDIHYKGWNKTWDERVSDDRIMKINEENLKKQKQAENQVKTNKKYAAKKTSSSSLKRSSPESDAREITPEVSRESSVVKVSIIKIKKLRPRSDSEASVLSGKSDTLPTRSVKKRSSNKSRKKATGHSDQDSVDDPIESDHSRRKTRPSRLAADSRKSSDKKSNLKCANKDKEKFNASSASSKKKATKSKGKNSNSASNIKESSFKVRNFGENIIISLSEELKSVLVDDFDYIGRQRKLLHIPCRYTVNDLINAYFESRKELYSKNEDQLSGAEEVCRGLKDYFNCTLGSQLLYKFERVQYADTLKENIGVPMAQLYGPIHLLRLITKLGPMLSATDIETVAMENLLEHVGNFVEYMNKHRRTLFQTEDYGTATPEYHRRAL